LAAALKLKQLCPFIKRFLQKRAPKIEEAHRKLFADGLFLPILSAGASRLSKPYALF
jgi:hypothetical protein